MVHKKICLTSDNWATAHPSIIKSIIDANENYAPAYGLDQWTIEAEKLIVESFKRPCKALFVPTGTGANVLAIKLCCRSYQSVICTDIAHIQYQETGAPEAIVGSKLLLAPHSEGKITPEALLNRLAKERAFGRHSSSPRLLSITQPTEIGTVYNLEELKTLSKICREENLLFHIDGSRLYNAAISLNVSLAQMIESIQVDVLSLGGTKNGLVGAEALLIFNPFLHEGSDYFHKQTLQLTSKMRYLSAQYIPYFTKDLWRTLASSANKKAQELAAIVQSMPRFSLSYPVQTNQIFFTVPSSCIPLIQEHILCYVWNREKNEIRWIASWNTSDQDVKRVKRVLEEIAHLC